MRGSTRKLFFFSVVSQRNGPKKCPSLVLSRYERGNICAVSDAGGVSFRAHQTPGADHGAVQVQHPAEDPAAARGHAGHSAPPQGDEEEPRVPHHLRLQPSNGRADPQAGRPRRGTAAQLARFKHSSPDAITARIFTNKVQRYTRAHTKHY